MDRRTSINLNTCDNPSKSDRGFGEFIIYSDIRYCKNFFLDLEEILHENCISLKSALAIESVNQGNAKFGTYVGKFGNIEDFHKSI